MRYLLVVRVALLEEAFDGPNAELLEADDEREGEQQVAREQPVQPIVGVVVAAIAAQADTRCNIRQRYCIANVAEQATAFAINAKAQERTAVKHRY